MKNSFPMIKTILKDNSFLGVLIFKTTKLLKEKGYSRPVLRVEF